MRCVTRVTGFHREFHRIVPGFRKEIPLGEESVDGFANHLCPGILKQLFKRRIA